MDLDYFIANVLRACEKKNVLPTIAFREAGIGQNFINNMKKGSFPSIEKVYKLTKYLGVTTSELLGESADGPTPVYGDEAALDEALVSRLCRLTAEELEKVDAFVQGLLAAR